MKRAQITLFIIIGVVALFMAGLMLYYVGLNLKRPAPGYEDVTGVMTFVNACIDSVSDEALLIAGQQSGIIFASQGGAYPDFQYVYEDLFYNLGRERQHESTEANPPRGRNRDTPPSEKVIPQEGEVVIPSSIISPAQGRAPEGASSEIPEYPRKYFPYEDSRLREQEKSYRGYFGINVLRKLQAEDDALSVQSQSESYISSNLRSCTNFPGTQAFPEYNIAETGEVKTSVVFAETDTVIKVAYPLEITKISTGDTTYAKDFLLKKKVRMKRIYEVANYLINKDITDVTFDIANSEEEQGGGLWGMQVERTPIDPAENVGTFITIIDYESDIGGKPYAFTFTRQNRNPALEYIKMKPDLGNENCHYTDSTSKVKCDFIWERYGSGCAPCCNERGLPSSYIITSNYFTEHAKDPDEDSYYFRYSDNVKDNPLTVDASKNKLFVKGIKQIVNDEQVVKSTTLEDWQEVEFTLFWEFRDTCSCHPCPSA